jgi:hypothetical protein
MDIAVSRIITVRRNRPGYLMSIYVYIAFGILCAMIVASVSLSPRSVHLKMSSVAIVSVTTVAIGVYVAYSASSTRRPGAPHSVVTQIQTITTAQSPDSTDSLSSTPLDTASTTVIGPGRHGSVLSLADFFAPDTEWEEGSFNVADRRSISGIAHSLDGCSNGYARLELRLGDLYSRLTFKLGQSNNSVSSDRILTAQVQLNGRLVLSKSLPFNVIQSISVSVVNVNSLILTFSIQPATPVQAV